MKRITQYKHILSLLLSAAHIIPIFFLPLLIDESASTYGVARYEKQSNSSIYAATEDNSHAHTFIVSARTHCLPPAQF